MARPFEADYDDDEVRAEQASVLFGMAAPFLLALGVLQLAQLFPAVRLARRIQAHEAARSRLLRRAIEASELERQRIARDLHDEVIQDLSGLSYVLESEERHGPQAQRALFADARRILQDNVRSLRGHFGLRIMEDAIGEAGGTLQVMSASGRGTTVIARFGAANDAVLRGVPQPVP